MRGETLAQGRSSPLQSEQIVWPNVRREPARLIDLLRLTQHDKCAVPPGERGDGAHSPSTGMPLGRIAVAVKSIPSAPPQQAIAPTYCRSQRTTRGRGKAAPICKSSRRDLQSRPKTALTHNLRPTGQMETGYSARIPPLRLGMPRLFAVSPSLSTEKAEWRNSLPPTPPHSNGRAKLFVIIQRL